MWVAIARSAIGVAVVTFIMWALTWVLDPILEVADSGPHSGEPEVARVGGYFDALTLENLVLIGLIAIAVYLIYRAVVERRRTI